MKFVLATVVLYIAKTQPQKPKDKIIPPKNPGKPESLNALRVFFLQLNIKKVKTVSEKNKDLQNNICHNVAPSKDLTMRPPKLKLHAPRNTNKGPGNFAIIFIKFVKLNFEFPFHTT